MNYKTIYFQKYLAVDISYIMYSPKNATELSPKNYTYDFAEPQSSITGNDRVPASAGGHGFMDIST